MSDNKISISKSATLNILVFYLNFQMKNYKLKTKILRAEFKTSKYTTGLKTNLTEMEKLHPENYKIVLSIVKEYINK